MIRLLVCGGRDYGSGRDGDKEAAFLRAFLESLHANAPVDLLIHGGQTGADSLAGWWAERRGIETLAFPVPQAEWDRLGGAAGPIRNRRMIVEGRPDLVLAFPGDRGTRDMVRQARRAGIPVRFAGWSG